MFNMTQVGINISKMRKSKGLTQMELADKLGISFQAVSNWERGISMPDISKLGELSALFDVSTDEILGSGRISEIAKNILTNQPTPETNIEDIKEIAPILHENQVESLVGNAEPADITAESIAKVAPFLSQDFIDNFAKDLIEKNSVS